MSEAGHPEGKMIAISSEVMGRGDDDLGRVLMRSYLHTLTEVEPCPDTLVFLNAGVLLAADDSPALDDLRAIAARGTRLLLCGTCVNAFDLANRVGVGTISNMYAISETMLRAGSVINL